MLTICCLTALFAGMAAADEVTKLEFYFPVVVGGALQKTMQEFVDEFNAAHPEYEVEMIYTGNMNDNITKLQSAVQAGDPPAFYLAPYNFKRMLDSLGIVDSMQDLLEKDEDSQEYLDDFIPVFIRDSFMDGQLVSIPWGRSSCIFYYNKDAFREVGLDPENPPTTWEELTDAAIRLTKKNEQGEVIRYGYGICENDGNSQWPLAILTAENGGAICNDEGTETYFDSEACVGAMEWWVALHNEYKCVPDYLLNFSDMPNMFVAGTLAMMQHTSGNLTNIYGNADFEVGVALMPGVASQTSSTGGQNFYICTGLNEKERQGAWEFIRYCTTADVQARWSAACGYIATVKSAFETDTMKEYMARVDGMQGALDQLEAGAVTEINTYEAQTMCTIMNDYIQAAILGEMSPREAMEELQAMASDILSAY